MQALMIAVLPLVGVLIGAILQYTFGQRLEARKQHNVQRAQAYIDFFRAVAALGQNSSKEQLGLAADAKTRICIYGSPSVVQKLGDFEKAGAVAATDAGQTSLVALMEAMRDDVAGSGASLQREELRRILFGRDSKGRKELNSGASGVRNVNADSWPAW